MTYKYKNFYYLITLRPDPYGDWILHISTDFDAPPVFCKGYETEQEAEQAAELWIDTVHKTVRTYYRL